MPVFVQYAIQGCFLGNSSKPFYIPERKTVFAIFLDAHIVILIKKKILNEDVRYAKKYCRKRDISSPDSLTAQIIKNMFISLVAQNVVFPAKTIPTDSNFSLKTFFLLPIF